MVHIEDYIDIPLSDLEISRAQVRLNDVDKDIDELVDSISKVGLLEPILVASQGANGKYEIILGQRRVLAHKLLRLETIKAGILSEHIPEIEAKVLSVTENLVRSPLNRRDLIEVCEYLYRRYGSMRDVAAETGLPYQKVSEYVKHMRLIPELKKAVDSEGVDLKAALRAQDALSAQGEPDSQEAVKLAKEMSRMSGAQQKRIQDQLETHPSTSVDEVVEQAKSGEKVTQIIVTLGAQIHGSLGYYARDEGMSIDEAAAQLIENALLDHGYETNGGTE